MKIEVSKVERLMQIARDIKKEFTYNKSSGVWYWYDRGEETDEMNGPFPTFLHALHDATSPYTEPDTKTVDVFLGSGVSVQIPNDIDPSTDEGCTPTIRANQCL